MPKATEDTDKIIKFLEFYPYACKPYNFLSSLFHKHQKPFEKHGSTIPNIINWSRAGWDTFTFTQWLVANHGFGWPKSCITFFGKKLLLPCVRYLPHHMCSLTAIKLYYCSKKQLIPELFLKLAVAIIFDWNLMQSFKVFCSILGMKNVLWYTNSGFVVAERCKNIVRPVPLKNVIAQNITSAFQVQWLPPHIARRFNARPVLYKCAHNNAFP